MLTELIPNLFIGNWHDARDNADKFCVVTVANDSPFAGVARFTLVDGPGNDAEEFRAAVQRVCLEYIAGKRVLVHCIGGRSRSAAVIVAAATMLTGRPMCSVYDELLAKHDKTGQGARIHPHLAKLLLELCSNQ